MELTQAAVNDLLARLGPGDSYMYLPDDLDPQDLTDLLAGRYGAPRTLALDGDTDPTVDDSRGAALLVPFEGRAVTIRAWAYGDQWVDAGIVRDAEGAERSVLVIARREVPEPRGVAPGEGEDIDWTERLRLITGWTLSDQRRRIRLSHPRRPAPPVHDGPLLRHSLVHELRVERPNPAANGIHSAVRTAAGPRSWP
ncbi:hypothetical protein ACPB9J_23665 [Streptomyces lavendulocolor]|uniref:hypothetical protein n=1 Tax=Streptomyces lavendulocolor TaxID=67316 RepID=UPI003C305168